MTVDNVFIDPCDPIAAFWIRRSARRSTIFATALGSVTGLEASAPTDVTVAGSPGERVDLHRDGDGGSRALMAKSLSFVARSMHRGQVSVTTMVVDRRC